MSQKQKSIPPSDASSPSQKQVMPSQSRGYWLAVVGLTALAILPLWITGKPPLQDYPDHLLQTFIIRNYDNAAFAFSKYYDLLLIPNPYSGYMFIIAAFNLVLPIETAGRLFLSLYAMLFPLSIIYLFRSLGKPTNGLELIGFPFTYNILFLLGNVNYILGVAVVFFGLGYLWRKGSKVTILNVIVFVAFALGTYLIHGIVFGLFMLGLLITALLKWQGWRQTFASVGTPLLATLPLLVILFLNRSVSSLRLIPYSSFIDKAESLVMPFLPAIRFEPFTEARPTLLISLLFLSALALTLLILWRVKPSGIQGHQSGLVYGGLLVIAGLVLPLEWIKSYPDNYLNLWRVDNRLFFPGAIILIASSGLAIKRLLLWQGSASLCAILLAIIGIQFYTVGNHVSRVAAAVSENVPAGEPVYIIPVLARGCGRTPLNSLTPAVGPLSRAAFYSYFRPGSGLAPQTSPNGILLLRSTYSSYPGFPLVSSPAALVLYLEKQLPNIEANYEYVVTYGCNDALSPILTALKSAYEPIAQEPPAIILKRIASR